MSFFQSNGSKLCNARGLLQRPAKSQNISYAYDVQNPFYQQQPVSATQEDYENMIYYTLKHVGAYGAACDDNMGCKVAILSDTNDAQTIKENLLNQGYTDLGNGTVMGNASIDLSQNNGKLLTPTIIQASDSQIKIDIPQSVKFTKKADRTPYTSTIVPPTPYSIKDAQQYFDKNNQTIIKAFKV